MLFLKLRRGKKVIIVNKYKNTCELIQFLRVGHSARLTQRRKAEYDENILLIPKGVIFCI